MNVHEKIITLLTDNDIKYRLCEHAAEGHSAQIAKIRGNDPHQAMKAIVLMGKIGKKDQQFYLAIVPGDKMLDLGTIKDYYNVNKVIFAPLDTARALSECQIGAIPPFSFNSAMRLIVDPQIKDSEEIVFNAGLLTKSIFMKSADYIRIVKPIFVPIAK